MPADDAEFHAQSCPLRASTLPLLRPLVFAAYYPPHRGGYERTVSELAEQMAEYGCDVTVVTCDLDGSPSIESRRGVRVFRLPSWRLLGGTYVVPKPSRSTWRLLRLALEPRPTHIHTHTRFFLTSALGWFIAGLMRVPLIHTEHGAGHSALSQWWARCINQIVDHTLGTLIMRRANVVGISRATAAFCRHLGASRVTVIPDGVDTSVFAPSPSSFREQHDLESGDTVVIFVGRLVYGKGVLDLLAAWPEVEQRLAQQGQRVRLVVVGDGPLRTRLEAEAARALRPVIFTGGLSTRGVVAALNAADVFVSPSYTEGLGLTLLEAAAVGLPIVASGVEGILDIIDHEQTGLLVQPGQCQELVVALTRLVSNPALRATLGARARAVVRARFNWHRASQDYLHLYRAALGQHTCSSPLEEAVR